MDQDDERFNEIREGHICREVQVRTKQVAHLSASSAGADESLSSGKEHDHYNDLRTSVSLQSDLCYGLEDEYGILLCLYREIRAGLEDRHELLLRNNP